MSAEPTDRNLLFGVLAFQADFLDAGQFAEACSAWPPTSLTSPNTAGTWPPATTTWALSSGRPGVPGRRRARIAPPSPSGKSWPTSSPPPLATGRTWPAASTTWVSCSP
jgi:hypothetical protein